MGVQPIRGVGMVRLRLRVSGARANHLCGRAEESRADTRACCERGVRALSTQRRLAAVVIQRTTGTSHCTGCTAKLRRPRNATRARAPSRRDAPTTRGAAPEPPTLLLPPQIPCSARAPPLDRHGRGCHRGGSSRARGRRRVQTGSQTPRRRHTCWAHRRAGPRGTVPVL